MRRLGFPGSGQAACAADWEKAACRFATHLRSFAGCSIAMRFRQNSDEGAINIMTWETGWLWIGAGLLLAGCSAQSDQDAITAEIAQSIRVGDAAADARPGYGFDLYPGAEVTGSLMDGMSLSIRTDDSLAEIVAFYEGQLIEKGWQIESRKMEDGKVTLSGVMTASRQEIMNIRIAQTKREQGHYHLFFIKLLNDE